MSEPCLPNRECLFSGRLIDMSDEILRLRAENERLQKYEQLVIYIANDYWELSHDKIKWLYTEYKNKCRKLIEEDHD